MRRERSSGDDWAVVEGGRRDDGILLKNRTVVVLSIVLAVGSVVGVLVVAALGASVVEMVRAQHRADLAIDARDDALGEVKALRRAADRAVEQFDALDARVHKHGQVTFVWMGNIERAAAELNARLEVMGIEGLEVDRPPEELAGERLEEVQR